MRDSVIELARRAEADPHFLAFALAEYAASEGLDEPALLVALGATPGTLASARLCRMPRADEDGFREDVDRIAAKFALNRDLLAKAARRGQVVAKVRRGADAAPSEPGVFIAARDKTE